MNTISSLYLSPVLKTVTINDTVGKLSDGSMSDGDGGRVGFAKQAVPGFL